MKDTVARAPRFYVDAALRAGGACLLPEAAAHVARPKGERAAARHVHWQKVAIAACEQCGRNRVPAVHPMVNAAEYRDDGAGTRILLSPRAELALSKLRIERAVTIVAGPE